MNQRVRSPATGGAADGLPERVLATLADRYALEIADCRLLRAGTSVAVFRIITADGVMVVRAQTRPNQQLARQHELLRLLAAGGLPVAPPVPTADGEDLVAIEGRTYTIHRFLPGDHPAPADVDAARVAGDVLARLHVLTRTSAAPAPNPRDGMRERFLALAAKIPTRVAAVLGEPTLSRAHDDAAWLRDCVVRLTGDLTDQRWEGLARATIHGDLGASNMLVVRGALTGIVDFDLATRDLRAADIAIAIQYLARSPAEDGGLLRAAPAHALVEGYETVTRLSGTERRAVRDLVETKLARSSLRKLRQLPRMPPADQEEVVSGLARSTARLRRLHLDDGWLAALAPGGPDPV